MSKDWERLRNFMIFKIYASDKELEEMAPFMGVVFVVIVVGFFIYLWFTN